MTRKLVVLMLNILGWILVFVYHFSGIHHIGIAGFLVVLIGQTLYWIDYLNSKRRK